MKFLTSVLITRAAFSVSGFVVSSPARIGIVATGTNLFSDSISLAGSTSRRYMSSTKNNEDTTPCDFVPSNGYVPNMLKTSKDLVKLFRSTKLTDVNGQEIVLGEKIASNVSGKSSVVVFLRHLG